MANTQTTVPLFVANQVLTAAQQNLSAGTGVPVFATTVTRDAAFGGSNKALAEGQLAYIEASNIVQYYDGAAWATVGPATASALTYITGASFSAVTSVSAPASTFTSTYQNYKLFLNITSGGTDGASIQMRMRVSGTDNTSAVYFYGMNGLGANGTRYDINAATDSKFIFTYQQAGLSNSGLTLDILSPQETVSTRVGGTGFGINVGVNAISFYSGGGTFLTATSFDAFSLISSAGNFAGSYKVYGYSNS